MNRLSRIATMLAVAVVLAALPLGAWAEGDIPVADGPSLSCTVEPLPVRAFELRAARITCRVTSAPATETTLSVFSVQVADSIAEPICVGALSDGAGACSWITRDGASIVQGQVVLTARLDPSGTMYSVPPPEPAATPPAP